MDYKSLPVNIDFVCKFLQERDLFVILTHASPDGDALGAGFGLCLALQKMNKRAKVLCPDPIPQKYFYFTKTAADQEFVGRTIIAVDLADTKLLGGLEEEYGDKIELCIDHHISNTGYASYLMLDPDAAATCECIYDIIKRLGVEIDKNIALALYTGISTDTGCFKYSNTTAKTHLIAAELINTGIDSSEINRIMFDTKSRQRLELERMALADMEYYFGGKCSIITVTKAMIDKSGCTDDELEGITSISRAVEGIVAGVTIKEKLPQVYKISIRTHAPLDASSICRRLGGGGHARAAGCELKGPLEDVKSRILGSIKQALEEAQCTV